MAKRKTRATDRAEPSDLRIIGGTFRGSKLHYHGDTVTRPMKHRVREAIFNLLSTDAQGRHAIDLFAGTGALGLEALSRGSSSATFIEKHVPTARTIEANIAALGVQDRATLLTTSAFLWGKRDLPDFGFRIADFGLDVDPAQANPQSAIRNPQSTLPWLVFCSPPYSFYVERQADMLDLLGSIQQIAPTGSVMVVEADERFDFALLGAGDSSWDIRTYPPAVVGIWRK